ncbi:O-methyltransferase [Campylobacter concisus]
MIRKIVGKFIPVRIKKQLNNFKILAYDYAQYSTIKNWDCVDGRGSKIPWYTYPAIEFLNTFDFSEKSVFEFGSGNSSAYWAKKAKDVISVEHDKEWFKKVNSGLNNNQTLLLREDGEEYEKSILEFDKKFDVIVIDGIRRPQCSVLIERCLNYQSDGGGIVMLDNSDWFRETAKYLREKLDLIEIDFHGFGPINDYTWTTSIFITRNFKFKSIDNIQPVFSVSAIRQSGE